VKDDDIRLRFGGKGERKLELHVRLRAMRVHELADELAELQLFLAGMAKDLPKSGSYTCNVVHIPGESPPRGFKLVSSDG